VLVLDSNDFLHRLSKDEKLSAASSTNNKAHKTMKIKKVIIALQMKDKMHKVSTHMHDERSVFLLLLFFSLVVAEI
jgi:hypothetical protein